MDFRTGLKRIAAVALGLMLMGGSFNLALAAAHNLAKGTSWVDNLTTTDNTVTEASRFTTATNKSYFVEVTAVGRQIKAGTGTVGDTAAYKCALTVSNEAGTPVVEDEVCYVSENGDIVASEPTFTVSGVDAKINVTGASGKSVAWYVIVNVIPLTDKLLTTTSTSTSTSSTTTTSSSTSTSSTTSTSTSSTTSTS